jgi:hypothetical protein
MTRDSPLTLLEIIDQEEDMGKRFPYGKCRLCTKAIAIPGLDAYKCSNIDCDAYRRWTAPSLILDTLKYQPQSTTRKKSPRKKS